MAERTEDALVGLEPMERLAVLAAELEALLAAGGTGEREEQADDSVSHERRPADVAADPGAPQGEEHGPFDPDELVRWAENYGHPETWAKQAQVLHGAREDAIELLELAKDRDENVSPVDVIACLMRNEAKR